MPDVGTIIAELGLRPHPEGGLYAGDPLALSIAAGSGAEPPERHVLGTDLAAGQRPQLLVEDFELAAHDREPGR